MLHYKQQLSLYVVWSFCNNYCIIKLNCKKKCFLWHTHAPSDDYCFTVSVLEARSLNLLVVLLGTFCLKFVPRRNNIFVLQHVKPCFMLISLVWSLIIKKEKDILADQMCVIKKLKHKKKKTHAKKRFCLNMTCTSYHPLIILSNAPMGKIQDVASSTSEWISCLLLSPWIS